MFRFLWIAIFCIGCTTIKNPHQESTQSKKIGQELKHQGFIEGCAVGMVQLILSMGQAPEPSGVIGACMELYRQKLQHENAPAEMKDHEDDPFI